MESKSAKKLLIEVKKDLEVIEKRLSALQGKTPPKGYRIDPNLYANRNALQSMETQLIKFSKKFGEGVMCLVEKKFIHAEIKVLSVNGRPVIGE